MHSRRRCSQADTHAALRSAPPQHAGLGIVGAITNEAPETEHAFLEGGDFFPAGEHLALVGVGLRTNYAAAKQLMEKDLLGCRRLAVVRDDFDQSQDRMHLDCVFSLLSGNCCLMLETIMGVQSKQRRLVDVWQRPAAGGKYTLAKEDTGVEFSAFMKVSTCPVHCAACSVLQRSCCVSAGMPCKL